MTQTPLWAPTQTHIESTRLYAFMEVASQVTGQSFSNYDDLWRWSVDDIAAFWSLIWDFTGVVGEKGSTVVLNEAKMPGAQWFSEARLNYAENLLRRNDQGDALVFWGEDKVKRTLSYADLQNAVAKCQQGLIKAGVEEGDRVAGYLPNMPEAIIAMLATSALGAVWCSASPDFGLEGVTDRFGQIDAKVLFCVDGYYYNGKTIDCMDKNARVVAELPSIRQTVVVPYVDASPAMDTISAAMAWSDFGRSETSAKDPAIQFNRVPFDHPLFIMFSSGTTGKPKCIVHSVGGSLLQHLKEHQLHADVRENDRLYYFTTCGWMMWNWLVSGLASGATLLLYDGSPFAGDKNIIFDFAEAEKMTQLGTSAKFIEACNKFGLQPNTTHHLDSLRAVFSTGSPLAPESYDYVYQQIKPDVQLASISGGTDILSCFALGCPILPVWKGELQCRGLGMAVDVFDDDGKSVSERKGELVCTHPFPSMPIGFWNDPEGERYHAAYFDRFDNIWCHGDFVEITERGGMIIHGRSDAVLNPGGVRIGTAEIYRQVEKVDEVMESIVIGQNWNNDVRVVLFVKLRDDRVLDDDLTQRIKQQIRSKTTPRHVPAKVVQVIDIPRTRSGKIVELAVRDVVHGRDVKNKESLANPEALDLFIDRAELAS